MNLIMGRLHLCVRSAAIGDMLVVQQPESLNGHLVNLARQTADTGARRELVESANAVFMCQESNENGLHAHCFQCDSTMPQRGR